MSTNITPICENNRSNRELESDIKEDYDYPVKIHKEILDLFKNKNSSSSDIENLIHCHINDGYQKFKDYLEMQENHVAIPE